MIYKHTIPDRVTAYRFLDSATKANITVRIYLAIKITLAPFSRAEPVFGVFLEQLRHIWYLIMIHI